MLVDARRVMACAGCSLRRAGSLYFKDLSVETVSQFQNKSDGDTHISASVAFPTISALIFCGGHNKHSS